MKLGDQSTAKLMKRATRVARGTVFFMRGGQLYMARGSTMFDRAGSWMGYN